MPKSVIWLICAAAILPSPAMAQFKFDTTELELRTAAGLRAISNLKPGETAHASFIILCSEAENLYVSKTQLLDDKPSGYSDYRVTLVDNDHVSLFIGEQKPGELLSNMAKTLRGARLRSCSTAGWDISDLYQVTEINTYTSASQLFEALKKP
ncbi:hypothetical protein [Mesorhizobium sp. M0715]|uniref:hypothetical protein n=1 Tax=Mesorhizobium sp. M0715 TaxID=2956990 RepID=UPI00333B6627